MADVTSKVCATCGHYQTAHIYEEGACRPGFRCEAACELFVAAPAPTQTVPPMPDLPEKCGVHGEGYARGCWLCEKERLRALAPTPADYAKGYREGLGAAENVAIAEYQIYLDYERHGLRDDDGPRFRRMEAKVIWDGIRELAKVSRPVSQLNLNNTEEKSK